MRNALCCIGVLAAAGCLFAQSGGGIQGVISDESGQLLAGAYVIASPVKPGRTLMAVSQSGGAYSIAQTLPGNYTICVQVPHGVYQRVGPLPVGPVPVGPVPVGPVPVGPEAKPATSYLDSCYWSAPTQVTVTAGQVAANINVRMVKASVVHVRLNDPGKHMASGAGVVLVGVVGPSSRWHPLNVVSSDASGRTLELAIPFNTALSLEVNGGRLLLADEGGAALASVSASFPIVQAAGQKDPTLTFNITGKRP
jgi:hypothetical protein